MALAQSYFAGMSDPFSGVVDAYSTGLQAGRYRDQNKLLKAQQQREMQMYGELDQLDFTDEEQLRQFVGRYPKMSEGVQSHLANLTAQEQQAYASDISRANALLKNGKTDEAYQYANTRAQAYANSGNADKAKEYADMAEFIRNNPQAAQQQLAMSYALMTPKDAADAYATYSGAHIEQDKLPHEIDKIDAETDKTESEADRIDGLLPYEQDVMSADATGTLATAKKDIATAQNIEDMTPFEQQKLHAQAVELMSQATERGEMLPYKKALTQAQAQNQTAQGNKTQTEADYIPRDFEADQEQRRIENEIEKKKLVLQSEKNQAERQRIQVEIDKLKNEKAMFAAGLTKDQVAKRVENQERLAQYSTQKEGISTALSTVNRLIKNKGGLESAVGAVSSRTPSFRKNTVQFEKDIETLKSQVFLAQIPQMKGMGALTDMEGAKLESSIANLDLSQSEGTIIRNLDIIYGYLRRAQKRLDGKYEDLLEDVAVNETESIEGRSYMAELNN